MKNKLTLCCILIVLLCSCASISVRDAVLENDTSKTRQAVSFGKDKINEIDSVGYAPLHYAVRSDNLEIVRTLLEAGANVDVKTLKGETALFLAASSGKERCAFVLLDFGASASSVRDDNLSVLAAAFYSAKYDLALRLIEKGALVNNPVTSDLDTALMQAVRVGNYSISKALLQKGALVNALNVRNESALSLAWDGNRTDIIQLLFSYGANADIRLTNKTTPLVQAIIQRNATLMRQCIDSGGDPQDAIDFYYEQRNYINMFNELIIEGRYDCADVLIKAGLDLAGRDSQTGLTSFHWMMLYSMSGFIKTTVVSGKLDVSFDWSKLQKFYDYIDKNKETLKLSTSVFDLKTTKAINFAPSQGTSFAGLKQFYNNTNGSALLKTQPEFIDFLVTYYMKQQKISSLTTEQWTAMRNEFAKTMYGTTYASLSSSLSTSAFVIPLGSTVEDIRKLQIALLKQALPYLIIVGNEDYWQLTGETLNDFVSKAELASYLYFFLLQTDLAGKSDQEVESLKQQLDTENKKGIQQSK